MAAQPLHK